MLGSYGIRTDLALEATERFTEENVEIRGVEISEDYDEEKDVRTTVVKITTENGARTMGRPQGNYITIEAPGLSMSDEDYHREISEKLNCPEGKMTQMKPVKSNGEVIGFEFFCDGKKYEYSYTSGLKTR